MRTWSIWHEIFSYIFLFWFVSVPIHLFTFYPQSTIAREHCAYANEAFHTCHLVGDVCVGVLWCVCEKCGENCIDWLLCYHVPRQPHTHHNFLGNTFCKFHEHDEAEDAAKRQQRTNETCSLYSSQWWPPEYQWRCAYTQSHPKPHKTKFETKQKKSFFNSIADWRETQYWKCW